MLKNFTFGQFFPGRSFLHRMDPRMKLILTFALIVIVFVSQGFVGFAAILGFVVFTALSSQISLRFLLRGIRPILFILLFTFVLNVFFQSGGSEIFRLGFLRITDVGLRTAFFIAARLILLVVSTQMLTLTTSPTSLTDGSGIADAPAQAHSLPRARNRHDDVDRPALHPHADGRSQQDHARADGARRRL